MPDELRSFLSSSANDCHGAMFRVLGMTGLRRGEACGLRWTDVDLDEAVLVVRHTITVAGREARPGGTGKSRNARRTVGIDARTIAILRAHRRHQLEERMLVGRGYRDAAYVFARPDGAYWHPDLIGPAFNRAVAKTELPPIRLHDLRHSHACHLLMAGVNVKVVSERLGHASVSFTLDTYGHVMPGQQADAAAAVATLVDGVDAEAS